MLKPSYVLSQKKKKKLVLVKFKYWCFFTLIYSHIRCIRSMEDVNDYGMQNRSIVEGDTGYTNYYRGISEEFPIESSDNTMSEIERDLKCLKNFRFCAV